MVYKTHIAVSLSLGFMPYTTGLVELYSAYDILILLSLMPIFALMPDLDEPNSYLSNRTPIIPHLITLFTKHRAFTHQFRATIILILAPMLLVNFLYIDIARFIPGLYLAYLGHILGDSFTKGGIKRLFYPFSVKTFYGLPKSLRFKTGSWVESIVVYPLALVLMLSQFFLLFVIYRHLILPQ